MTATAQPGPAPPARARRRAAITLDVVIVVLAVTTAIVAWTGGGVTTLLGVRISARGVWRPLLATVGAAALRFALAPRLPWLGLSSADWQRIRAPWYQFGADEDVTGPIGTRRTTVLAIAGLIGVAVVLLFPQLVRMDQIPDRGDPLFSIWRLGWVLQQLRGDPRPLFDANIFYPTKLTFTFSDSMLLPGLTAAPLLASGLAPVVAYNVVLLSGFVLSAIAAYLLAERLTGSPAAGFVAGVLFGFYAYRFEHYSHLELQMTQWAPLALLAAHRFLQTYRWRYVLGTVAALVAQLYSSMYYAVFLTIYAGAVLAVLVATRRPPVRRVLAPVAVAGVLGIAAAMPLMRPYSASTELKGERGRDEVEVYSAAPSDFLRSHFRSVLYSEVMLPDRQPERALFPGVAPLALAAVGLVPPLGPVRLAYAAAMLVAVDGSLGFNGWGWSWLYEHSSIIRGLRVPARFSVFLGLSLAVLGAFGVKRLLARARTPRARTGLMCGIAALAVLDAHAYLPLERIWPEPPPIYGALAGRTDVVLAEFPLTENYGDNTPYLYFSLWHWANMMNGYSGFLPDAYNDFERSVVSFPDDAAFASLEAHGVTHITVNCGLYREGCEALLDRVEARDDVRRVAQGRWQGRPVRLYELKR